MRNFRGITLCLVFAAGCLAAPGLRAEIAQPQGCKAVVAVAAGMPAPYGNQQGTGRDAQLAPRLARLSGIDIQLQSVAEPAAALQMFASGQVDLWLAINADVVQQAGAVLIELPHWQINYQLWFRYGELLGTQQAPQLNGLRLAFWPQQLERELLEALPGAALLNGLQVADRTEAVGAVLSGHADFFLADRQQLLLQPKLADELEALEQVSASAPIYLALSNQSACNDAALQERLSRAVKQLP